MTISEELLNQLNEIQNSSKEVHNIMCDLLNQKTTHSFLKVGGDIDEGKIHEIRDKYNAIFTHLDQVCISVAKTLSSMDGKPRSELLAVQQIQDQLNNAMGSVKNLGKIAVDLLKRSQTENLWKDETYKNFLQKRKDYLQVIDNIKKQIEKVSSQLDQSVNESPDYSASSLPGCRR